MASSPSLHRHGRLAVRSKSRISRLHTSKLQGGGGISVLYMIFNSPSDVSAPEDLGSEEDLGSRNLALKNLDISIASGEKVAICGRTGG